MKLLPSFTLFRLAFTFGAALYSLTWAPAKAQAAELVQVPDWNKTGFPGDISMYAYVPDRVAENPPLLVLIHYCGGTAPDVFGQARGGGLVGAADEHGFVIIAPSSGRCWDVVSDKTRQREGQGDSHAIRSMVGHAATKYGINLDRVYATGDSSGGMMTELLLGVYPDVFRGGSAMAGMPAACRGDSESPNGTGYSGACAGGNVSRTAEEWGDLVRSLAPSYSGPRPRVQLFHGDNDTLIRIKNHTEAIKQWTNVHGLSETPTEEQPSVPIGNHSGPRQTWKDECGLPVIDAFTSRGGDHGPSDALFLSEYIVPFLALDETGATDPQVEGCGMNGTGGAGTGGESSGGAASGGGSNGQGGSDPAAGGTGGESSGGASSSTTGGAATTSSGGTLSSGGALSSGGQGLGGTGAGGLPIGAGGTTGPIGAGGATGEAPSGSSGCSIDARSSGHSGSARLLLALGLLGLGCLRSKPSQRRAESRDFARN
jgi:acetylxylan esterase